MARTPARRHTEVTHYSDDLAGDRGNYGHVIRADVTDGYVGLTEVDDGRVTDRVLLSPAQWRAVVAFVRSHRDA